MNATASRRPKDFTAKAAQVSKNDHVSAAASPALAGSRAAAWLATWDKGNRKSRLCILEAFIALHAQSNSSVIDGDLGDAAPLFFTRLTSWLRLTYKSLRSGGGGGAREAAVGPTSAPGSDAGATPAATEATATTATAAPATPFFLLVQSITLFVRGSSYMTQMIEVGTAATLTDALVCGTTAVPLATAPAAAEPAYAQLSKDERRAVLLLLLFTANAGRVYREMVCEEDGLVQLLHAFQRETDAELAALFTELFLTLGQGNPRMAAFVHTGLLRVILCRLEYERVLWVPRAAGEEPPFPSRPTMSHDDPRVEATLSEDVVFQSASSLRALQLAREARYLSAAAANDASPDVMPIVGLGKLTAVPGARDGAADPMLAEAGTPGYLAALFFLALHETSTRLRVEGCELLSLAAKNINLTQPILTKCLDVLEDDAFSIEEHDDVEAIVRRQRRQLSCGRATAQIMLGEPMSSERKACILDLVALRSGHLTLLKYLRMADSGDAAAVVDCCRALQTIVRAIERQEAQGEPGGRPSAYAKMGRAVQAVVGEPLYQMMLYQDITEEESFTILRAARRANASVGGSGSYAH